MTRRSTTVALATVLAATAFLAGCATGVQSETMSVIPGNDILTANLANDVTAKGVVLAAVLLVAGDIDKAMTKGTVTQAEVDAAREAMADGTLDMWRQRAESDEAASK